jgi:hypothetical protein
MKVAVFLSLAALHCCGTCEPTIRRTPPMPEKACEEMVSHYNANKSYTTQMAYCEDVK